MALSLEEKETIIRWDEKNKTAFIDVPVDSRVHKRLIKLGCNPMQEVRYQGTVTNLTFEIPANWVKINAPRELTEKQKQELAERAKRNLQR